MTAQPNNPQAFPCLDNDGFMLSMRDPGMTLRDWLAGQCLNGYMSQEDTALPPGETIENVRRKACASWYAWADAMLAERERAA